jgi:anti-anti-sigma factor
MHRLQFQIRHISGVNIVRLTGTIEPASFPALQAALNKLVSEGTPKIALECYELNYISSAELKQLLNFAHFARAAGGDVKCVGLTPTVKQVANIVANGDPFDCYDDLTYALAAFRRLRAPPSRN